MKRCLVAIVLGAVWSGVTSSSIAWAGEGNRLVHLDEPNNPWQFERESAKLITPQWIGEEGVDAVIVLAIDDMSGDGQRFRDYLTPIIERLKVIDERGAVSITCNRPDPDHPNMQWLLSEGVSLETHTLSHPCPLLQRLDFDRASADYHGCVDLLARIPNNQSVGFRFGCMDGQNTPSPRAYAEILNRVSEEGRFVSMSTSVGVVFTENDPDLPNEIFREDAGGSRRFSRYLMDGFVNYVEDYPYPFVVGGKIWELPFVYPNDYTGQALHGSQNPTTMADFKAAVDAAVAKQGAVSLCFHAGGWMRNDQMVDIVDHTDRKHGRKAKFLNMREMHELMIKNMLAGHPLRDVKGGDNGVRVFDVDGDGYMDVVIGNSRAKLCRIWNPERQQWREMPFPAEVTAGLRFGVLGKDGRASAIATDASGVNGAWRYDGSGWVKAGDLVRGLDMVTTHTGGVDNGVRMRDLDGDGICELIASDESRSEIYRLGESGWKRLPFALPAGCVVVTQGGRDAGLRFADLDEDGHDDVVFSDGSRFGTWMFGSLEEGWNRPGLSGAREGDGVGEQHPRTPSVIPPIVRKDGSNNGAWVKRNHVYWQSEDTGAILPHHIDKRSFADLMGDQVNKPRSPEASLRAMEARPGFRVELVAAEPLVMDPVDVAWGADGRMWVAEMADYPMGLDHKGKPGSRIVVLTDRDGDGRYDERLVFAEGLETANTVLPWRDGVLVVAPPHIWFMRDTTGDGAADDKQVLYEGFGRGNEQHRGNGLVWGLDGWLYVANGDSGGTIRSTRTGKTLNLGGFDLRIRPDTGELEPATGITQHGRNRDDWGNWIAGNNSNGWQIVLEDHEIRRNPKVKQPAARHGLFGVIDLYPSSHVLSHWSGYQRPPAGSPGKLTSGCGYTFYRDALFDSLLEPSVFFSCPVHNCVHRDVITWNGVLMQVARADDESQSEFLRSSDSWFRPTAIRTGPDGALYVADFYRLVIEHPEWIDDTLEREMIADGRLRAGHDRGRIYKVYPSEATLHENSSMAGATPRELVAALDSSNGWRRDTSHMMLTWLDQAGRESAGSSLRALLRTSKLPVVRAQVLSALADLGALEAGEVLLGLNDDSPGVRRNALRVGAGLLSADDALGVRATALLNDEDAHVQRQAALALGEWSDSRAGAALGAFLTAHASDPYLRAAAMTSAGRFPDHVLLAVLEARRTAVTAGLVNELMGMLGSDAGRFVPPVLQRVAGEPGPDGRYESWRFAAVAQLLAAIGDRHPAQARIEPLVAAAWSVVGNESDELNDKLSAMELIVRAGGRSREEVARILSLLRIETPIELQVAAARAILEWGEEPDSRTLLDGWAGYGPSLRVAIIDGMLMRTSQTRVFMSVLEANPELAVSLDAARRQLLLRHENEEIRGKAEALLGSGASSSRQDVVRGYTAALPATGDREKGKDLFARYCSTCHRLDGVGKAVGPDLAALSNRSSQAYLTAILDPNSAIQENWMLYLARTKDGRSLAGALVEETSASITLAGVDGEHTRVGRGDLVSVQSTGRSLMPEGLEASLGVPEMTDLISYLRVAGEPRKKFENNVPKRVVQADDYTVTLPSAAAEIYGPRIVFEQKYRNLGYWSSPQDRAEWTFSLQRDGEYDLWVDWALHDGSAGGRIQFTVADRGLKAPVPATGSWDNYRWGKLGSLRLEAGNHRMVVRSDGDFQAGSLIDLRQIRLVPKGRDGAEESVEWPQVDGVQAGAD